MSQTWITECVERTGLCGDETIETFETASRSEDDSDDSDAWMDEYSDPDPWRTVDSDSDCGDEANATTGIVRNDVSQSVENIGGAFLPTRLLDLFPIPAHAPDCIRLVESVCIEKEVKYAALSYCWGNVKPTVLTTRANLDSHQQNIKLLALPQCLRDAVTVARGLEIRYLWIDALCIIQGDSDDWARESATMCQLFQNAYVTIAAATSESFDEGFLSRRPYEAFDIDFASTLHPQAAGKITLSTVRDPDSWEKSYLKLDLHLDGCKWDTRGWVWQEQKLSKRLLVFGKQMIHFRCDHHVRSENGDNVLSDPPSRGHRGKWTKWLDDYTPKHFTFLQDKLPAISGLAKQIDQNSIMRGDGTAQYLAGIWYCSEWRKPHKGSGWQHQLFWSPISPGQSFQEMLEQFKCTDLRTYTAPSWSWASRREKVLWWSSFLRYDDISVRPSRYEARIEDHQMNLTGPDPTGRVGPYSYLKLRGLLSRDPLNLSEIKWCGLYTSGQSWYVPWTNDTYVDFSLDWDHSPTDQLGPLTGFEIRLFCLWRQRKGRGASRFDQLRGLLLIQDGVSGLCFRVGIFIVDASMKGKRSRWHRFERWERQCIYIL